MRRFFLGLPVLMLAMSLGAGGTDSHASVLAPFVDEQTMAVARVDITRVNIDTPPASMFLSEIPADVLAPLKDTLTVFQKALARYGRKEVYAVWTMANAGPEPCLLIPASSDSEAENLTADLRHIPGLVSETKGTMVLAGNRASVNHMRQMQPAARPELAQALAAVHDMPMQVAVIPPKVLRRSLIETFPQLPHWLGGGPSATLNESFVWFVAGVDSPRAKIELIIQARDQNAALAINQAYARWHKEVGEEIHRKAPKLAQVLPLLKLQIQKDRLILALDERALEQIAQAVKPAVGKVRDEARRARSANNLKQMALAIWNYHDVYKGFPMDASYDKNGKPLLSWRVHLLPFLEQAPLYKEFHLDEPWDSEHNKKLVTRMPEIFRSPFQTNARDGTTVYLAPVGKNTMFPGNKKLAINDVVDGTSNTLLILEVNDASAQIWTKPGGFDVSGKDLMKKIVRPGAAGFLAAFTDGAVHFLPRDLPLETLRAVFTRNGGEAVNLP
jgi:hypothetical protein